jgi:hypothetical protein
MAIASDSKRSRPDEGAAGADATPVSRVELEDLLAQAKSSIAADSTSLVQHMEQRITNDFSQLIRAVDSANQARFSGIDSELLALRERADASESSNAKMRDQLAVLSKALVVAEKPHPTRRDITSGDWDKDPDPNLLRINFAPGKHATKASTEAAVKPWLDETNIKDDQWELIGPESSKNYVLKFIGAPGLGAKRAKAAYGNLKDDNGKYRDLSARDLANQEVRMYLDENKSPKQRQGETDARRMGKIIRDALPDRRINVAKRDFSISIDHVPIVRFVPVQGQDSGVLWN